MDTSYQPSQQTRQNYLLKFRLVLGVTKTFVFAMLFQFHSSPWFSLWLKALHTSEDATIHEAHQVFSRGEIMQTSLGKLPAPLTAHL